MWVSDVVILGEDRITIFRSCPLSSRHDRIGRLLYQVSGLFTKQILTVCRDTLVSSAKISE